jgi:hypothetical protein
MPTINLPFFFRIQQTSLKPTHGWCMIDVDVPEVSADALQMAVCETDAGTLNFKDSQITSVYVYDQRFYRSAARPRDMSRGTTFFNEKEVLGEVQLKDLPEGALKCLTEGIGVRLMGGLAHRQRQPILTTKLLDVGSVDPSHIAQVRQWAAKRLLMCEGRILSETQSPSLMLKLGPKGQMFNRAIFQALNLDREHPGIYFGYPSEDFYRLRDDAQELGLLAPRRSEVERKIIGELVDARKSGEFVAIGSSAFNVAALSKLTNDEYLAKRSLDFTARECFFYGLTKGQLRYMSEYITFVQEHIGTSPEDKTDTYFDKIIEGLNLFRVAAEPWESWVTKCVIERFEDREITTKPVAGLLSSY